jgi:hypothetical protein
MQLRKQNFHRHALLLHLPFILHGDRHKTHYDNASLANSPNSGNQQHGLLF